MHDIKSHSEFSYWKRPWHKWLILAAGLLQFLGLWMNIQEYNNISRAGILSASEWANYAAQKYWQCAINGVLIAFGGGIYNLFIRKEERF